MPTLLITGGAGYIGSLLVVKALNAGFRVHVFDSVASEKVAFAHLLTHPRLHYFVGNLTEPDSFKAAMEGAQVLIHLAGVSDGRAGKANPERTYQVNLAPLENLLTMAQTAGLMQAVFASTMGVYGNRYTIPLHENLPLAPMDPYSQSKAQGEAVFKAANSPGFVTTNLRLALVYGPSPQMRHDFIIHQLLYSALKQRKIKLFGGNQQRPHVHIEDATDLILALVCSEPATIAGETFNVVSSNPSLHELVNIIQAHVPNVEVQQHPMREGEDSFVMDGSKLSRSIPFAYHTDLNTGIARLIDYFQYHEDAL